MSLKLRQIEIRITTLQGIFGVRVRLDDDGLIVIRADNTSGKSTLVQGLIYGLGLEAMLTANQQALPLQYAITEKFLYEGREVRVSESEVLIEMQNSNGEIITTQRPIISNTKKKHLITVWNGPALTEPENLYDKSDYFVRIEGAAQREMGFHTFFAKYLGWTLPEVSRFDGSETILYLECIFPLFVVEQKHGWSGIQSRLPTHFGIREMGKRSIEFVLKLDSYAIAQKRQRIREDQTRLNTKWERSVRDFDAKVGALGSVVRGLPPAPRASWPGKSMADVLIFRDNEWVSLGVAEEKDRQKLAALSAEEIPSTSADAPRITALLRDAQRELVTLEVLAARSIRDNSVEEEQNVELRQRLASLQADRQSYLDLRRLHSIGADLALEVASKHCPTCDQSIEDVLLPQGALTAPMALEENLRFISGQITTFQTMLQDSERVLENRSRSVTAISSKLQELRTTIRSYRDALISSQNSASAGAVRERLVVEVRLQTIQTLKNMMNETVAELTLFSEQYGDLQRALEALKEDRSVEDEAKLSALQASFLSQLDQYGFSSITPTSALQISRETFRPTYEAFDLGFNLSASDMIRTIWSYLNGLMEVARTQDTNHLGLLVLDEPRQQQANKVSFSAFALRASQANKWHQQMIFLTSEDQETLERMMKDVPHQMVNFEGKLIQPLQVDRMI